MLSCWQTAAQGACRRPWRQPAHVPPHECLQRRITPHGARKTHLFRVVVGEEEEVVHEAFHGRELLDGGVVPQVLVDVWTHERRQLGPHAVLHAEPPAVHAVADHALEQRHLQLVVARQPHYKQVCVHSAVEVDIAMTSPDGAGMRLGMQTAIAGQIGIGSPEFDMAVSVPPPMAFDLHAATCGDSSSESRSPDLPPAKASDRESRIIAEKQRRSQYNTQISEMMTLLSDIVHSQRKVDKTSVLRLAANKLRNEHVFGDTIKCSHTETWSPAFLKFFDLLGGFMITVTCRGRIFNVSPNVQEKLGYCHVDLLGQDIYNYIHPEDKEVLRQHIYPPELQTGCDQTIVDQRHNFNLRIVRAGARSDPPRVIGDDYGQRMMEEMKRKYSVIVDINQDQSERVTVSDEAPVEHPKKLERIVMHLVEPSAVESSEELKLVPPSKENIISAIKNSEKIVEETDALLSVKLDPAVLEAQVTVDTSAKTCAPEQDDPTVAKSKRKDEPSYPSFEEALSMQQAALLKLSPQQLELLMAFVDTLRRQRIYAQRHLGKKSHTI
ncbi:hypothetical protein MSG28_010166 [Choristoneura fumiferana]|uniref:Uncharacterized protein n=1 Tax=Choristoneura fumiferana TaxID=7141 RepID=A0ACC0KJR0_CHOFU|nr:hypothetical protein MSG28_010166 [Choristoneura fumiferana]